IKNQHNDVLDFLLDNFDTEEDESVDPVESKIDLIYNLLKINNIVLIQGDTGCGKTTKIPRLLLKKYKNIVCTQPRRIAAISVAKRVSKDLNTKVGDLVGYAVRFEDCISKNTRLRFVTDGILLREISQYQNLEKYDCIVIDEAHERTINIDILLGFCKSMLDKNHKMKIVIMSATLATENFINFFNCPFIDIKHKKHPLENYFLKNYKTDCWFEETLKTIVQLEKTEPTGDILVFLTGQEEIKEAHEILKEYIDIGNCKFFTMYSSMPIEEQELVFEKYPIRKIILSTNVCETSITIENIKFVIDCGRVKQMRYSDNLGMYILETAMISKAQARQRSGRAGRTG
ncbi:MAG: helicase-related protein, partial [Lactobacillaceae bacterium]